MFATAGDPYYKVQSVGNSLVQQLGRGGSSGVAQFGGAPGPSLLRDGRADNDYYGIGYDLASRRAVLGELLGLFGGAGGGGGGDKGSRCPPNLGFINDASGGGGGGGGGALLLLAGGRIVINEFGRITCNGGHGGGGEQAGTNLDAGGGGGGSGGMVALYSYTYIEIRTHGDTYANNDFDFAISADGGLGLQGPLAGSEIAGKYPPPPASAFDARSSGGFGGLGVIQLATPVNGANSDGTNTILDDNVHIVQQNGQRLTGVFKQRYLAWRGYLNASGVGVDDRGVPTAIGANEGDLRPSPSLLPLF